MIHMITVFSSILVLAIWQENQDIPSITESTNTAQQR